MPINTSVVPVSSDDNTKAILVSVDAVQADSFKINTVSTSVSTESTDNNSSVIKSNVLAVQGLDNTTKSINTLINSSTGDNNINAISSIVNKEILTIGDCNLLPYFQAIEEQLDFLLA